MDDTNNIIILISDHLAAKTEGFEVLLKAGNESLRAL